MKNWFHRLAFSDWRQYIPSPIRSGLRRLGTEIGLLDERAIALQLHWVVYKSDTFIVSYPKSGNTWVRFLIANMHHPEQTITLKNLEEYIPSAKHSSEAIRQMDPPRFIKTHMSHFDHFPRCVYIYRDVRDVAISFYHYSVQHSWYEGTISEFIRDDWPWDNLWGPWDEHVRAALDHAERDPKRFLLLQYEEMLEQPMQEACRLADFCNLDLSESELRTAVQDSSFDKLQSIEEEYGHDETEGEDVTFFREGRNRQWEEELSNLDREILRERFGRTLERLGYRVA